MRCGGYATGLLPLTRASVSVDVRPNHKVLFMKRVLIIHEVDAYPAWKAIFDQAAGMRKRAGEISYQLLRYDNDANKIVHFSEWSSLDKLDVASSNLLNW